METAVRPITDPRDVSMLHRIEVDVIDVTLEVSVVADCMLPKPSLPDSRFASLDLAPRPQLRCRQLAGKSAFDLPPACNQHRRAAVSKWYGDGLARHRWRSFRMAGAPGPHDKPAANVRPA